MNNPAAMSIPSTQTAELEKYFLPKEIRVLGNMADSTSGTGNVQEEPGTSCIIRQQRSYQRLLRQRDKRTKGLEIQLKRGPHWLEWENMSSSKNYLASTTYSLA